MKKIFSAFLFLFLFVSTAYATNITGTVTYNNIAIANGSVQFTLLGCSNPLVNSSVGNPAVQNYTFTLNSSGNLPSGSVTGNDIIYCSGLVGTTYYQLQAFNAAGGLLWNRYYRITGSLWNIDTATVLTNFSISSYVLTNPPGDQIISTPLGNRLTIAGGLTLIDNLELGQDPTTPTQAATKNYVDNQIAGVNSTALNLDSKLSLTGGTMTGPLLLAGDPTQALGAATKQYVDNTITAELVSSSSADCIGASLTAGYLPITSSAPCTLGNSIINYGITNSGLSLNTTNSGDVFDINVPGLPGDPVLSVTSAGEVYTANSILDDGSGNMRLEGGLTLVGAPSGSYVKADGTGYGTPAGGNCTGTTGYLAEFNGSGCQNSPIDDGQTTAGYVTVDDGFKVNSTGANSFSVENGSGESPGWVSVLNGIELHSSYPLYGVAPENSMCGAFYGGEPEDSVIDCVTFAGGLNGIPSAPGITIYAHATGGSSPNILFETDGSGVPGSMTLDAHGLQLTSLTTTPVTTPVCPNGPAGELTDSGCDHATTINGVTIALGGSGAIPFTCGGIQSTCAEQQLNPTSGPASTTVASAMTATQTTIPVVSGAGFTFAPNVIVQIAFNSKEFASCTGYTAPNLTGCTRNVWSPSGTGTGGTWAVGASVIQVVQANSASATSVPSSYVLANQAFGYGPSGNATANSINTAFPASFSDGFSAAGAVTLAGGTNTIYSPQAVLYEATNPGSNCATVTLTWQQYLGSNSWGVANSNANCTTGTNSFPANSLIFTPGTTSGIPNASSPTVAWLTPGGYLNVLGGVSLISGGTSSNCFHTDGSVGSCGSGGGGISGLITGFVPVATSSTSIGNSTLDYNITNAGDFTFGAPALMPTGSEVAGSPICTTATGCGAGSTLTLTTTGASGAATYSAGVLNIPVYVPPSGAYFLLNPTGSQNVTIPSGYSISTSGVNTANYSVTEDIDLYQCFGAGWNNGQPFNGNGDWSGCGNHSSNFTVATAGIAGWSKCLFTHTAEGDTQCHYDYLSYFDNLVNGNDEGVDYEAAHIQQLGQFFGPISTNTAGADGTNTIVLTATSCTGNCGTLSYNSAQLPVGGFAVETPTATGPLTVSAYSSNVDGAGEYTLSSGTVTPSTAYGTVAANCTTSVQGKFGVYGTQTCTVNVLGGTNSAGFTTSSNVFHVGQKEEEDTVQSVGTLSGGTQTIVLNSMYPFFAGEFIGQGGPGGMLITQPPYDGFTPVDFAAGAPDSTHIFFGHCVAGHCAFGGNIFARPNTTVLGAATLTRSSNVVTLTCTGTCLFGTPSTSPWAVGSTVTVSGASLSDFDGSFTVVTSTRDEYNVSMTWAQTGANETASGATLGFPLYTIDLTAGAMVCGTGLGAGNTINACTNHAPWTAGHQVVGAPSNEISVNGHLLYMSQYFTDPSIASGGDTVVDLGPAQLQHAFGAINTPSNGVAAEMFYISGSYQNIFQSNYTPANNGAVIDVQCNNPVSGSSATRFHVFQGGNGTLDYDCSSQQFIFGNQSSSSAGQIVAPSVVALTAASQFAAATTIGGVQVCLLNGTNCPVPPMLTGTTGTITGTVLSASCDSGNATVTGATVGHTVAVSSTTGADVGGAFNLRASVTSANTVTVYVCGTGTPASLAFNVSTY